MGLLRRAPVQFLLLLCLVRRIATKAGDERYAMQDVADEDSFQLAISSSHVSLVLFSAPHCPESAAMRSDVGLASNLLDEDESAVAVLSVDGTRDPALAASYGIRAFPALVVFRYSSSRDTTSHSHYMGPLGSASLIAAHMRVQAGAQCTEVQTAAQVEQVLLEHGVVVLGMFEQLKGKTYKVLKKATLRAHHQPRCLVSTDRELAEHYSATSLPVVMLLKRFDERRLRVPSSALGAVDDMHAFLRTRSLPLVIEYSRPTAHIFPYVLDGLSQLVVLTRWHNSHHNSAGRPDATGDEMVVGTDGQASVSGGTVAPSDPSAMEHFSRVRHVLRSVAKHSRARIAHLMLPADVPPATELLRHIPAADRAELERPSGMTGGATSKKEQRGAAAAAAEADAVETAEVATAPGNSDVVPHVAVFMVNTTSRFRYKYEGEFSAAKLKAFEASYLAGTLTPTLLSAGVSATPAAAGEVLEVVGDSFDDLVLRDGVDVLLTLTVPWCSYCTRFKRGTLKRLARRFARTPSVRIAALDAQQNEVAMPEPEQLLQPLSFPALLFFPAHDKGAPVWFGGASRGLEVLTKFVQKHAEIAFEHSDTNTEVKPAADESLYADTALQCGLNQWPPPPAVAQGDSSTVASAATAATATGDRAAADERVAAAALAKDVKDDDDDDDDDDDVDDGDDGDDGDDDAKGVMSEDDDVSSKSAALRDASEAKAAKAAKAKAKSAAAASTTGAPMNMTAVFTNKLKRRVDLHYDVKLWSTMKPGVMVSVTTYTGHRWSAHLDGRIINEWQMDSALGVQQEFDITLTQTTPTPSPSPTPEEIHAPVDVDSELSLAETIKKYTNVLVAFFAPPKVACEHCGMLKQHFHRAAFSLAIEPVPTTLVNYDTSKLDRAKREALQELYGIQNFPAYKLVFNGRLKPQIGNYLGGVTEHEIVSFFRRNSDQPALVKRLRTIKAADAYFRDREAVVLVHVPPGDPQKVAGLFELFEQAALQFRALDHGAVVPFAFTTSTLVSSEYNLKKAPSVAVLRTVSVNAAKAPLIVAHYNAAQLKKLVNAGVPGVPGAPVTTQASPKSVATITEFVRKHALSRVVEYNSDTHNLVFSHTRSDSRLVVVASEADFGAGGVRSIVAAHARQHLSGSGPHLLHVTVVPSERLMLGVLGIVDGFQKEANQPPMAMILNTTSFATYEMDGPALSPHPLSIEALDDFVAKYFAGEITASVRSQPDVALIEPDQRRGGATEIAGSQYPSLVQGVGHDVLVWLYQPWCASAARCASFAKTFRAFGHFASVLGGRANASKSGATPLFSVYKMGLSRNSAPHLPSRGAMAATNGVLALYTGDARTEERERPFFFPTDGAHSVDALAAFLFKHSAVLEAPLPKAHRLLQGWNESAGWEAYDPPQITAVFCSKIKKVAKLKQNGIDFDIVKPGHRLLVTTFHDHSWTAEVKGKVVHSWRMNFERGPRQKLVISKQKKNKNKKKSKARG